jgi:hypothetical protein
VTKFFTVIIAILDKKFNALSSKKIFTGEELLTSMRGFTSIGFMVVGFCVTGYADVRTPDFSLLDKYQTELNRIIIRNGVVAGNTTAPCTQLFAPGNYDLIARARLIYGLVRGSRDGQDASVQAAETLNVGFVDSLAASLLPGQPLPYITPHSLAYAAASQLALYDVTGNQPALERAKQLWRTIRKNFKNDDGGLVNGWNPVFSQKTNIVDFASTVYVATASGLDLLPLLHGVEAEKHRQLLINLGKIVARQMMMPNSLMVERLSADLEPVRNPNWFPKYQDDAGVERPGDYSIAGHQAQAVWFLLRLLSLDLEPRDNELFKIVIRREFDFLLQEPFVDLKRGGIVNVFVRQTGLPYHESWAKTKAFWQQAELILALTEAKRLHVYDNALSQSVLEKTVGFLRHYFDENNNPMAAVVTAEGNPTVDDRENIAPIFAYHLTELRRFVIR